MQVCRMQFSDVWTNENYSKITGLVHCITEKDSGFLRIGSLNVRVKRTTEAFSNFLGVGQQNAEKIHKNWGSADNVQQVMRQILGVECSTSVQCITCIKSVHVCDLIISCRVTGEWCLHLNLPPSKSGNPRELKTLPHHTAPQALHLSTEPVFQKMIGTLTQIQLQDLIQTGKIFFKALQSQLKSISVNEVEKVIIESPT